MMIDLAEKEYHIAIRKTHDPNNTINLGNNKQRP
jgi:hypothetical protein